MSDLESPKAPAEALRQQILTEFKQVLKLAPADYTENCTNVVMNLVTAYATTVEREADTKARIDELWEVLDYVTRTSYDTSTGQKMDKYINDRLAALQGPQDDQ